MNIVGEAPKRAKNEVGLEDSDLEGVNFPHDDPLVIILVIGNFSVKQVFINNRASVNIRFHYVFLIMGYKDSQLTPSDVPIYRFNGMASNVEGTIQLLMTIGKEPREATQFLEFWLLRHHPPAT